MILPKDTYNPWQTLDSEVVYDNKWIEVRHETVVNPGGGKGIYGKVHYKNKAIGIVAIDSDNYIYLVGQYRYPTKAYSWEIPEGGGPLGEDPLTAAQRELLEETGLVAQQWTKISTVHLSNSVNDEEGYIYIAEELTQFEQEPEETEELKIQKIHLSQALELVLSSEITDSLSVIGILKVARLRGL
jgi:ADP-ribose pyrophosphatase